MFMQWLIRLTIYLLVMEFKKESIKYYQIAAKKGNQYAISNLKSIQALNNFLISPPLYYLNIFHFSYHTYLQKLSNLSFNR